MHDYYFISQRCRLFFLSYNLTILQFLYNFSLVFANSVCFVFFVCFIFFSDQSILSEILLISYSMHVLQNPQQPMPMFWVTCNEFVRKINNFIFNIHMQLIIAGLKTSLYLSPFCLLDLILAIMKKEKSYVLNIRVCPNANQNFPINWSAV